MNGNALQVSLGREIRRRRLVKGVSQEIFAEFVGVHRTYIGSVERGERNLSLGNLARIAEALGATPSALLAAAEEDKASIPKLTPSRLTSKGTKRG
jgi:transcriptional regulator with XRE-family HTH domain